MSDGPLQPRGAHEFKVWRHSLLELLVGGVDPNLLQ